MRKYNFLIFVSLSLLLWVSCGKREGAPDSRQRLSQVFSEEWTMMGESEYYHDARHLAERWNWDRKELYRIDYYDSPPYSEVFFYEGKQIIRTTVPAYNIRNEYFYDGRVLERIDCYRKDTLLYSSQFRHNDNRMVGMDVHYQGGSVASKQEEALLFTGSPLLGDMMVRLLVEDHRRMEAQRQKKGNKSDFEVNYEFTWDDDDVTLITRRVETDIQEIELRYDECRNPYAQLFGYRELNGSVVMGFRMLSEHNIVKATFRGDAPMVYNCSYQYDGNIPVRRTVTYTYTAADIQTLEETTYTFTHIDEYQYEE